MVKAGEFEAEGIVMGSRFFMATKESPIHENAKKWMASADETKTIVIQRNIGSPSRVALNEVSTEVDRLEREGASLEQ